MLSGEVRASAARREHRRCSGPAQATAGKLSDAVRVTMVTGHVWTPHRVNWLGKPQVFFLDEVLQRRAKAAAAGVGAAGCWHRSASSGRGCRAVRTRTRHVSESDHIYNAYFAVSRAHLQCLLCCQLAFLVSAGVFQSGSYHWMPSAVYASQQLPRDSTASDANANLLSCSREIGHSAEPAQRLEQLNAWSRLNGWRLEAVGAQQHMQLQTNPCKLTAPTVCCSGAVSAPGRGSEM